MIQRIKIIIKKCFKKNHLNFSGPFSSWSEALSRSSGYDSEVILSKVTNATREVLLGLKQYERDGTSFDKKPIQNTLVSILEKKSFKNFSIVDIGGGLGSLYINYKKIFEKQNFKYFVIEQKHFCDVGEKLKSEFKLNINFYTNLLNINTKADVVICSSFLQYIEDWKKFVNNILNFSPKYIIIDRHPLSENKSEIFIQLNNGYYEKKVTYPVHILNTSEFINQFKSYEIIKSWTSDFDPKYFKGYLLKKQSS